MDQAFVGDVLDRLAEAGIDGLLFGGWAEEAFGLCPPRPHGDIDLLWRADCFDPLDTRLDSAFTGIAGKRFAHKRAFLFCGVMVEITRVEAESGADVTWFWGDARYAWLAPLTETCVFAGKHRHVVSPANLRHFRASHKTTQPWRWRDPESQVPEPARFPAVVER